MPGELNPLTRGWRHSRSNGVDLWRSDFDEGEWVAACVGVGVEAATRAFAEAEKDGPVDSVLSTGWAGAMSEEFAAGKAYWISGVIDARTGERFIAAGPPNDCWLVTGPKVADAAEKLRLAASYGPRAGLVDMEAAGVARLARMRGIPFYCIKGVSDGVTDNLPDFNNFIAANGRFMLGRFMVFCILRPWRWLALARMGENSRKAAEAMGKLLRDFLQQNQGRCVPAPGSTVDATNRERRP